VHSSSQYQLFASPDENGQPLKVFISVLRLAQYLSTHGRGDINNCQPLNDPYPEPPGIGILAEPSTCPQDADLGAVHIADVEDVLMELPAED
jgi:hypothetical protein